MYAYVFTRFSVVRVTLLIIIRVIVDNSEFSAVEGSSTECHLIFIASDRITVLSR